VRLSLEPFRKTKPSLGFGVRIRASLTVIQLFWSE
jgi:hypothetical protein